MTAAQHKRLIHLADLSDRHMGRQVEVGRIIGELVGIRPIGDRIALTLLDVAGARIFTDAMPADECVEVWKAAS